jgi:predicted  nucleic acid-binding Zn-ribbon protein
MFKLDEQFLKDVGLESLPAAEKNKILRDIYETLEMRVGMRLANNMRDDQLEEFEGHIQRKDQAAALKWLETNFPDYKQTVAEEIEKLKQEITQAAPQILNELKSTTDQQPAQL